MGNQNANTLPPAPSFFFALALFRKLLCVYVCVGGGGRCSLGSAFASYTSWDWRMPPHRSANRYAWSENDFLSTFVLTPYPPPAWHQQKK